MSINQHWASAGHYIVMRGALKIHCGSEFIREGVSAFNIFGA
ncbi:MAG: hypothetical protein JWQ69_1811 [Pseudomonas sp.]|nr:hypothetical protein [Pseudomonas sp.]